MNSLGIFIVHQHAGWWPDRGAEAIRTVLHAAPAVGAWDGDRLVGFARVITDGLFHAYIEDVIVHEQYRRHGLGTALMARLLHEIRDTHLVSLFCKTRLAPFYAEQGFQPTNQVMMHRAGQQHEDAES